ncbi:hypothetical protein MPSEU_000443600 [Mayamaea pseudoterrestris]|nr:hypothetical protein MPSEU_000443600 [Mayamaea pseudoterrestris]
MMKLSCLVLLSSASAFSVKNLAPHRRSSVVTELDAVSRRNMLTFAAATITCLLPALNANADIDYAKVQDLLGRPDGESSAAPQSYSPSGRPTYLTEPTTEFKNNEARASEFKRKQIKIKQEFAALLDKLDTDPNDQDLLARDLDALRTSVRVNNGLPLGITKEELVKRVRRRKAKRFWPVQVEIAYQDLLQELRLQQSPNYKDEENPL